MQNKQFYRDQLEELLIAGQTHAICSFKKKHIKECVKYCEDKGIGGCITCQEAFKNWLNDEYKEVFKLTKLEFHLLKELEKSGFKYFQYFKGGKLKTSSEAPVKLANTYHILPNMFDGLETDGVLYMSISYVLNNCEVLPDA